MYGRRSVWCCFTAIHRGSGKPLPNPVSTRLDRSLFAYFDRILSSPLRPLLDPPKTILFMLIRGRYPSFRAFRSPHRAEVSNSTTPRLTNAALLHFLPHTRARKISRSFQSQILFEIYFSREHSNIYNVSLIY